MVPDVSAPTAAGSARPFYGKPFVWLIFALGLLAVPIVGYMIRAQMTWQQIHPAINAMLNGSAGAFLVAGYLAIRRRDINLHRTCMIAAFTASSIFLASYLARFAISGSHKYPGDGADKVAYLTILFSHMLLAAALVPLVLRTLYLGLRRRDAKHRAIAKWTLPIWMYVSVTGVIVYLMLYPVANALYGP